MSQFKISDGGFQYDTVLSELRREEFSVARIVPKFRMQNQPSIRRVLHFGSVDQLLRLRLGLPTRIAPIKSLC